ncbi:MAG TPA: glycosyltransferase family 39 protein [Gemmataceae bacterium]|nr:glycosyltransferase family 39 protein [Gemmataceae bacterium]
MPGRAFRGLVVAAFAVAVGHLGWQAVLGPPFVPKYFVGGRVQALSGTDPAAKSLYLRRKFYLSQNPLHAWLQVLAHDQVQVWVNGQFLQSQQLDGGTVAVLADLRPYLQIGPNVIAIVARQATIGQPPVVAVDGAYTLTDGDHPLHPDDHWRCSSVFDRRAYWWFQTPFEDGHWPLARVGECYLRGAVREPPRAVAAASAARWVTPATAAGGTAAVRRDFDVAGRPRQAWLRLTASSSYRLAVNDILIDQQENQVDTTVPVPPDERVYDITPVLQRGPNFLSLMLTSTTAGPPLLRADVEVEDDAGHQYRLGTDGHWQSRAGPAPDWLKPAPDRPSDWHPCHLESGYLDVMPWQPRQQVVDVSLPPVALVRRALGEAGFMVIVALVTLLAGRWAMRLLSAGRGDGGRGASAYVVYAALAPATLAIAAGVLATYDPRVGPQDVYRGLWALLAVASVPLQWLLLALLARSRRSHPRAGEQPGRAALRFGLPAVVMSALVVCGFWLRARDLELEPMQWDEVGVYRITTGFLECGFPSFEVHPDLPRVYINTSEVFYTSTALAALVFHDPRYVVRFPAVCWGVLNIVLIYVLGRKLFGRAVGLVAAALYTFSPLCIAMSNFGRYFEMLQFMTALTVLFFWLTIRGRGPIDVRFLWLTAAGFVLTFLSWEGGALIAPGMILAALLHRRGRLHTMLARWPTWAAMLAVALVIALQYSHRILQQTHFLWFGFSISDVSLTPMWRYPVFQPWYYVWASTWNQDTLLPILGLASAALLAVRHPSRVRVRFLLVIYLSACLITAALLPTMAFRYGHHLAPLLILLASAALVAMARGLRGLAGRAAGSRPWRVYAGGLASLLTVVVVALASGMTLRLPEMDRFRVYGYGTTVYKFPNLSAPVSYLRDHVRDGDVVIATHPFQINHLMGRRCVHYWLQSQLLLPATVDDQRSMPLDRRDGTPMLADLQSLKNAFYRHQRIWYIGVPAAHDRMNEASVSAFMLENMDVVCEDVQSVLLLRDNNSRPAFLRYQNTEALQKGNADFLK